VNIGLVDGGRFRYVKLVHSCGGGEILDSAPLHPSREGDASTVICKHDSVQEKAIIGVSPFPHLAKARRTTPVHNRLHSEAWLPPHPKTSDLSGTPILTPPPMRPITALLAALAIGSAYSRPRPSPKARPAPPRHQPPPSRPSSTDASLR